MNRIAILVGTAVFLFVGIVCLAKAHNLQAMALQSLERANPRLRFFYFERYLRSKHYVTTVRILGLLSIGIAAAVVLVWKRGQL